MNRIEIETFNIQFDKPIYFQEGEILETNRGKVTVLKVYKLNWYKKIFKSLGFKVKENMIKAIIYKF